jgi:hypothetical protein
MKSHYFGSVPIYREEHNAGTGLSWDFFDISDLRIGACVKLTSL